MLLAECPAGPEAFTLKKLECSKQARAAWIPQLGIMEYTGVGSLSLLQGISPIQGSNPSFLHCSRIPYQLSHKGSPRTPDWVAYPFSSGSSWPRNWTRVSCIAGRFFTNWATKEAPLSSIVRSITIATNASKYSHPCWGTIYSIAFFLHNMSLHNFKCKKIPLHRKIIF